MNRMIAPMILAISLSLSAAAVAAPLRSPADVTSFFQNLQLNGK